MTTPSKRTQSPSAIILTALAALSLLFLVISASIASSRPIIFTQSHSPTPHPDSDWIPLSSSPTSWNLGLAVLSTFTLLITASAFCAQDAFLTRAELFSPIGIPAIFLRPLTPTRAITQIRNRHFTVRRTGIVFSFLATALIPAAAVGLLSAQLVKEGDVEIMRVGGGEGQRGWFAVLGLLLLGTLTALGRVSRGAKAVEFEAQDGVALLGLGNAGGERGLEERMRVRFVKGTGFIWGVEVGDEVDEGDVGGEGRISE